MRARGDIQVGTDIPSLLLLSSSDFRPISSADVSILILLARGHCMSRALNSEINNTTPQYTLYVHSPWVVCTVGDRGRELCRRAPLWLNARRKGDVLNSHRQSVGLGKQPCRRGKAIDPFRGGGCFAETCPCRLPFKCPYMAGRRVSAHGAGAHDHRRLDMYGQYE